MTGYLIAALVALSGLLAYLWQRAVRQRDELRQTVREQQDVMLQGEDDIARLEDTIDGYREKHDRLLRELAACDDGAAVDLARRVLLDPTGDGAGAVPDDASTYMGGGGESGAW